MKNIKVCFTWLIIILIAVIESSCSEPPPKWMQKGFTEEDIVFSKIDIHKIQVNNVPIYTDLISLKTEFGETIDSSNHIGYTIDQLKLKNKGEKTDSIPYANFTFKDIDAIQAKGKTKITFITLINTNNIVQTEYGRLDKNTELDEFKTKVKDSYEWRNLGVSMFSYGYGAISENDFKNGEVVRLILEGNETGNQDEIELVFYKEKLAYVLINAIDLEYDKI